MKTRSGHRRYAHPNGRKVSVGLHGPNKTFPFKTLRSIIEQQAQWTEDDPRRLDLLS